MQGVALKYEEEFHQALSSFARAQVTVGHHCLPYVWS